LIGGNDNLLERKRVITVNDLIFKKGAYQGFIRERLENKIAFTNTLELQVAKLMIPQVS
jgi:hypothetical protein